MTRVGRKGGRKGIRGRIDNKEKRIGQTKKSTERKGNTKRRKWGRGPLRQEKKTAIGIFVGMSTTAAQQKPGCFASDTIQGIFPFFPLRRV